MNQDKPPIAIDAHQAAIRSKPSSYPEPFASRMVGRVIRPLGDVFGLSNFGVNWVALAPGAASALRHAHLRQDEFVYVLAGAPTLVTDAGDTVLGPGMCAGFRAGSGDAHMLVNRSERECLYLVVGDRTAADQASYPDDDIAARLGGDGKWFFTHKNGEPY